MKSEFSDHTYLPPKITEELLNWSLPKALKEPVVGDLAEEFSVKVDKSGLLNARLWYFRQASLTAFRYLFKSKKGLFMFILGILVFLGCTGLLMFMSGNFGWYIDIPSLLLVLPPALVLTMGVTSKAAMKRAFRTIVDDDLQATRDELVESQHVFNTFGNCALWLGGIGLIIGFIAIGGSLNAEDFAKVIGPAMAIAMTTILYALFIKTLCYVAAQKVSTLILRSEQ